MPSSSRLAELEQVIERGQRSFVEVGKALRTIRDERLYDAAFGTFEAYCRSRFGLSGTVVYQQIAAATVVDNLSAIADKLSTTPKTEGVARPLTRLDPDAQRKVWAETTDRWQKPTGANVETVIAELYPEQRRASKPRPGSAERTEWMVLGLDDLDETARALAYALDLPRLSRLIALLAEHEQTLRGLVSPSPARDLESAQGARGLSHRTQVEE